MRLFTIGFTKKNAEQFFGLLERSGASTLVDTRLNNVSQLAGFAKRHDLEYFARELVGMAYVHETRLAPTKEFLDAYKKGNLPWLRYEEEYLKLIRRRQVEAVLDRGRIDNSVLLCSEDKPDRCHRRLAADYLADAWGDVEIIHL